MNFLLVYCKDCFDHIHDYDIEVFAASVRAEFKVRNYLYILHPFVFLMEIVMVFLWI